MKPRRILLFALLIAMFFTAAAEEAPAMTPVPAPGTTPTARLTAAPTSAPAMPGATAPVRGESRPDPWGMPTLEPVETREPGILTGFVIGIDPGHQAKGNNEQEAVAPGSSQTKAKVSSGTQGVASGVPEHEVNLTVSLKLREALWNLGAAVYMTRDTAFVDISNQERAAMMNEHGCNLVLRIHCNGSANSSVTGIGTYVRETGEGAAESALAAEYILDAMCEATGAERNGVFKTDTYTGLNWSTVPSMIVEMGYMSNPEEDLLLNDPDYQEMLISGMVQGIIEYCLHPYIEE